MIEQQKALIAKVNYLLILKNKNQCYGAVRSRGFLAGAGPDLKFDLEPEPIFWFGSGSFFGKWKTKWFKDDQSFFRRFFVFGTKSSPFEAFFLLKFSFFKWFVSKSVYLSHRWSEPSFYGCSRSRYFLSGAEAKNSI